MSRGVEDIKMKRQPSCADNRRGRNAADRRRLVISLLTNSGAADEVLWMGCFDWWKARYGADSCGSYLIKVPKYSVMFAAIGNRTAKLDRITAPIREGGPGPEASKGWALGWCVRAGMKSP